MTPQEEQIMVKASAQVLSIRKAPVPATQCLTLACPVYNLAGLRAAVDNGANSIHIAYRSIDTSTRLESALARDAALRKGVRYAHEHNAQIVISLPQSNGNAASWSNLTAMIRDASNLGIDAITLSDRALMLYTASHFPSLDIHYAMPQSAVEADSIKRLRQAIPFKRLILPRVVSAAQIREVCRIPGIGVELAGFGKGCAITTSRGDSDAAQIRPYQPAPEDMFGELLLSDTLFHDAVGHCALPEEAINDHLYQHDHSHEWNALNVLPQLAAIKVSALRIELQSDSSSKLARLTRVWREAIDECLQDTQRYNVRSAWIAELKQLVSPARKG